jgi:tyrosyl-tRNA synthetase
MPLLVGLDGADKMSKSKNNYIGITESATEQFGKVMSINDAMMWDWYTLLSARPMSEIERFKRECEQGRNPRDVKVLLAQEIVERFHNRQAAESALAEFEARFKQGAMPDNMPEVQLLLPAGSDGLVIAQAIKQADLAPSTSEANRNIEQGGVRVNSERVDDKGLKLAAGSYVLQVGKRKFARVTIKAAQ